jgi:hypothetical protein
VDRKDFIKKVIGNDYRTILKWSGLLLVIYVLFSLDLSSTPNSILQILEIGLLLLVVFVIIVFVCLGVKLIFDLLMIFVPLRIKSWMKKNGSKIELFLVGLLFSYFVYNAITNKRIGFLVFVILFYGVSALLGNKRSPE